MDVIQSVGVVVFKGPNVLLVTHGEKATHHTGVMGIPAGRLEEGETHIQCAVRELREETGLSTTESALVRLSTYRATIDSKKGPRTFDWVVFLCTQYSGELKSSEETVPQWVEMDTLKGLKTLPNVSDAVQEALRFHAT